MKKVGITLIVMSVLIWLFYFVMAVPNAVTRSNSEIQSSSTIVLVVISILTIIGICAGTFIIKKSNSRN